MGNLRVVTGSDAAPRNLSACKAGDVVRDDDGDLALVLDDTDAGGDYYLAMLPDGVLYTRPGRTAVTPVPDARLVLGGGGEPACG